MVSRIKDLNNPPADLIDAKWDDLKADALITQNAHKAKKRCYRDTTIEELTLLYENKCAACERDRGIELEVDHFRPRKEKVDNTQYNNPGYYWLIYEWSNLIPLCSGCNRSKSNKFPIKGNRISSHINPQNIYPFSPYDINWLNLIENPLLVNPETESNLVRHFIFDRNGKMRDRTDYGKETIVVFKLNRRDLRRKRIKIRTKIVNEITLSFSRFLDHLSESRFEGSLEVIFDRIVQGTYTDHEMSLYYTFIYKYFDYFVGTKLLPVLRIKALDYFEEYKAENDLS